MSIVVATNIVVGAAFVAVAIFLVYIFLSGLIWGAGYSPTPRRQLVAAASLLQLKEGDTVYDLGSGFGRALFFFAKNYDVSAIGVEIDPLRAFTTAWNAERRGVATNVHVVRQNLLDVDLGAARKVFFFLTPLLMRRLQEKVAREMPPGSLVASVDHRFPDWKPIESVENVHLYVVAANGSHASTIR